MGRGRGIELFQGILKPLIKECCGFIRRNAFRHAPGPLLAPPDCPLCRNDGARLLQEKPGKRTARCVLHRRCDGLHKDQYGRSENVVTDGRPSVTTFSLTHSLISSREARGRCNVQTCIDCACGPTRRPRPPTARSGPARPARWRRGGATIASSAACHQAALVGGSCWRALTAGSG